jgi:hypothetical protein
MVSSSSETFWTTRNEVATIRRMFQTLQNELRTIRGMVGPIREK